MVEAFSAVVAVIALLASVMQQKKANTLQQALADVEKSRLERESDRRRESALAVRTGEPSELLPATEGD